MPDQITIALIQQSFTSDRQINIDCLTQSICDVANDVDLIVLPELHNSLYFCQEKNKNVFKLAEPVPGPTSGHLSKLAKQYKTVIMGSVFEKASDELFFNTAVVLDTDGSLAGRYRKSHIPNDPGYYEKFYFTPGEKNYRPIETRIGKLGVLICFDQWFPEAARAMAMAGADVLVYPTAIGFDPKDTTDQQQRDLDAWVTVQRGHAIANILPLAACNRTGYEPAPDASTSNGIQFWGSSFICGQQGEFIARAGVDENETIIGTIDFSESRRLKKTWGFFNKIG